MKAENIFLHIWNGKYFPEYCQLLFKMEWLRMSFVPVVLHAGAISRDTRD